MTEPRDLYSKFDVDGSSVVRVILQYLRENGFQRTLLSLQDESGVVLNAVENRDQLRQDILQGRWDCVLATLAMIKLPQDVQRDVYLQIFDELMEAGDKLAARSFLEACEPLQWEVTRITERKQTEASSSKRASLAARVVSNTVQANRGRLLALVSLAMQQAGAPAQLGPLDVFTGGIAVTTSLSPATVSYTDTDLGSDVTAIVSLGSTSFVVACDDGTVEVFDWHTGQLSPLPYQTEGKTILLTPIADSNEKQISKGEQPRKLWARALAVTKDENLLATGDTASIIRVWRLDSGKCVRQFPGAHGESSVTALSFESSGGVLLSAGLNGRVRLWGMKSASLLRDISVSTGFIGDACWYNTVVLAAASDGTARVLSPSDGTEIARIEVFPASPANPQISQLLVVDRERFIAVPATGNRAFLIEPYKQSFRIALEYCSGQESQSSHFVRGAVSPRWLYLLDDGGTLFAFDVNNGNLKTASDTAIENPQCLDVLALPAVPLCCVLHREEQFSRDYKVSLNC